MSGVLVAKVLVVGFGLSVLTGYFLPTFSLVLALSFALAGTALSFLTMNGASGWVTQYAARRLTTYFCAYLLANIILAFIPAWIAKPLDSIFIIVYSISIWTVWVKVVSATATLSSASPSQTSCIIASPKEA